MHCRSTSSLSRSSSMSRRPSSKSLVSGSRSPSTRSCPLSCSGAWWLASGRGVLFLVGWNLQLWALQIFHNTRLDPYHRHHRQPHHHHHYQSDCVFALPTAGTVTSVDVEIENRVFETVIISNDDAAAMKKVLRLASPCGWCPLSG